MIEYAIIIVIVLIIFICNNRYIENDCLKGFWVGDPDFLEEAELVSFIMFIGNSERGKRKGYILASNEDGIVLNYPINIDFDNFDISPTFKRHKKYEVTIDYLDEEEPIHFPKKQTVELNYPYELKFIYNSEIKAILNKSSEMSKC